MFKETFDNFVFSHIKNLFDENDEITKLFINNSLFKNSKKKRYINESISILKE